MSNASWARSRSARARCSSSNGVGLGHARAATARHRPRRLAACACAAASAASPAARRVRRQPRGSLEERGRGRQAAAGLRPPGRAFQLGGHLLVGLGRRVGPMPGPAVRIDVGIGRLGQGAMRLPPIVRRRPPGRPPSAPADGGTAPGRRASISPGLGRGRRRVDVDRRVAARPPATAAPGRRPARPPPPAAAAGSSPGSGSSAAAEARPRSGPPAAGASGSPKPPASSAGVSPRGSSSSASGLPRVSATIRSRTRSSSGPVGPTMPASARASASTSPLTSSSGRPASVMVVRRARAPRRPARPTRPAAAARRTPASAAEAWSSHCASSTTQTSGCSSAASASRLSTARPTRKRSGASPRPQTERGRQRVALRPGQAVQLAEQRRAQLVQAGERELHLRLDPDGPRDAAARRRCSTQVVQQRGLADPGVAAQHQAPGCRRPAPRPATGPGPRTRRPGRGVRAAGSAARIQEECSR